MFWPGGGGLWGAKECLREAAEAAESQLDVALRALGGGQLLLDARPALSPGLAVAKRGL